MNYVIKYRTCRWSMRYGGKDTLYCTRYGHPHDRTELRFFRAFTIQRGLTEYHCGTNAPEFKPMEVGHENQ